MSEKCFNNECACYSEKEENGCAALKILIKCDGFKDNLHVCGEDVNGVMLQDSGKGAIEMKLTLDDIMNLEPCGTYPAERVKNLMGGKKSVSAIDVLAAAWDAAWAVARDAANAAAIDAASAAIDAASAAAWDDASAAIDAASAAAWDDAWDAAWDAAWDVAWDEINKNIIDYIRKEMSLKKQPEKP